MERIFAVLTAEAVYARRLCSWLNEHRNLLFAAVPFADVSELCSFPHRQNIRIILADDEICRTEEFEDCVKELGEAGRGRGPRVLRLSGAPEGAEETADPGEAMIGRYQSAEEILREVMQRCQDIEFERGFGIRTRTTRVIGVYTPCSCAGRTAFSLALAKHISAKRKCLYLHFGEFAGLGALTGGEPVAGIADAVYYMKQNALTPQKLHSLIGSFEGIEYLAPLRNAEDLRLSGGESFRSLISRILKLTDYEVIVAASDSYSLSAGAVMDVCDAVYVPWGRGVLEEARLSEFREYLKLTGQDSLLKRTVFLELPAFREPAGPDAYAGRLLFGPLGDLVRSLHEGE